MKQNKLKSLEALISVFFCNGRPIIGLMSLILGVA